ncbi:type 1 fimbrial protein [Morganella morganii]|uniref:fimbrial protein n=1 Tax=Morganella morganii TaxID=582 RepID=UPI00164A6334|nr:fimbrial protein [Morganella morganii]MBC4010972.1 type 1 fimbrial protein [Morganella morganii]MCF1266849.1 type 1 fimbrial protein [Morganella morganii]
MSMKKIVLALAVSSVVAMTAQAANQGGGKVNFHGEVIDAACSIDANSLKQTVELGSVAKVQLAKGGKSTPVDFTIQLHNCDTTSAGTTTVSFNGVKGDAAEGLDKAFSVSGPATGALGVVVTDAGGNVIEPNTSSSAFALNDGDNTLNFKAYMQGASGASKAVAPGEFTATADFVMAYQ